MKRKALKITAFVVALVLIIGISWFANALVGNPISKFLAEKAAEKHISEVYGETDFQIERVMYDFKAGNYSTRIFSPTSIDSHFSLAVDFFGNILYDNYEYSVLSGDNTAIRIGNEYRNKADAVLDSPSFPYYCDIAYGDIEFIPEEYAENPDVPSYAIVTETLRLDGFYDVMEMGRKAGHLVIYVTDDTVTEERLAEVLLGIKDTMDKSGVAFYAINCVIESPKSPDIPYTDRDRIEVLNFLYSDIYEENLVERVNESIKATKEYYERMDRIKEQEIAEYQASLENQ